MKIEQQSSEAAAAGALYRLPTNVVPEKYHIVLTPDLEHFVFTGSETIHVRIQESTNVIVLNASEVDLQSAVLVDAQGTNHDGTIELDNEHQFARITFASEIESGEYDLHVDFTGEINDKLNGWYRSFYTDPVRGKRPMATTQFETTDARKAFPCFDEPAFKAKFTFEVNIPEDLVGISNGEVVSEEIITITDTTGGTSALPDATGDPRPLPSQMPTKEVKRVRFLETELVSTYVLCLCVGDFEASETVQACGIKLRVMSTPGKNHLKSFALKVAKFGVEYYTKKWGVPYGFGKKIDLIAVKEFAAGAMENPGAITFRETAVLVDERTATVAELKRVADVVLHELAHMWFGDLVTMTWWTWLWLNESFATFMSLVCMNEMFPEWHVFDDFAQERAAALRLDSLKSTHPIECPVHRPEETEELFDLISYEKGCSVLYMIYQYMGADNFMEGVSVYLRKFAYGNAEGKDLWNSLQDVCDAKGLNLPVRDIMLGWVLTPGHPVIEVAGKDSGSITLAQRDFKFLPEAAFDAIWPTPVHMRVMQADGTIREEVLVLTERSKTVEVGKGYRWVVVNSNGNGFFRVIYTPALQRKLTAGLNNLSVVERYNLVNDSWSAVRAGLLPALDYLELVKLFSRETDPNVWSLIIGSLGSLHKLLPDNLQPRFARIVRDLTQPTYYRLGWDAVDGEPVQTRELRGAIIGVLGTLGRDEMVQSKAARMFVRWKNRHESKTPVKPSSIWLSGAVSRVVCRVRTRLGELWNVDQWGEGKSVLDPNVLPAVIGILATTGDAKRYDEFFALFQAAKDKNPQDEARFMDALAEFNEPELYKRAAQLALTQHIRSQDAPFFLASIMTSSRIDKRRHAWKFVQENWDALEKAFPSNGMVKVAGAMTALDTEDLEREVNTFLAAHPIEAGTMAVSQALEQLRVNVALRQRETQSLVRYFERAK
jgi:puromycin-sensitive aminopeptidase